MNKVQIKVSGENAAVEQFMAVIREIFALSIESKLLKNNKDAGVHCFVDLDPYALKELHK